MKILIVDDDNGIRKVLELRLASEGFEIISARSAREAYEILGIVQSAHTHSEVDLILMDINMPVLDGMECTKIIRKMDDPNKSRIPILAITGNAQNYSMEDFKAAGINEYLQKPLDFDLLVSLVVQYTS